jgi:hypothetical protein
LLFPNILGTKEWDFAKAEEVAALGYTVLDADLYGEGQARYQHGKRHGADEGDQR